MTMTCHVLHVGDGYQYLINQVASADVERAANQPLTDYYAAEGNPPGRWVGSGLADLGVSGEVSEAQMLALFGEGLHPDADRLIAEATAAGVPFRQALASTRLGRRFYRYEKDEKGPLARAVRAAYEAFADRYQRRAGVEERRVIKERVAARLLKAADGVAPTTERVRAYIADELGKANHGVAGFDLVFSPVKSVSLMWALGGREVRRKIEKIHETAWRAALAYGEREADFTRTGTNGVAQIDTHGFVVAAFDHRDSRAGDPDLHTHAVVGNRVLGVDGQWRTLDGQQLFKVAVSMSEFYNAAVEQGMTEEFGVDWTEKAKAEGLRGVREIAGMPEELIRGLSRRSIQVDTAYDQLVRDYVRRTGHTPPRSEQMRLADKAVLIDRPRKDLKSLAAQLAEWRTAAQAMLPGRDLDEVLVGVMGRVVPAGPLDADVVAAQVIEVVSKHRSSWTVYHVRAEAIRQLKPHGFATAVEREQAVEQVVATALERRSVTLSLAPDRPPPTLLQRADGASIYQRHGSTRYTSTAVLDAETRLLDAASQAAGPVVAEPVTAAVIAAQERATGPTLDPGQRDLVAQFVGCGRALAVAIGPPGSGKSTAMRVVRAAWATTGGRVIGLAPSAVAADTLGHELEAPAHTLHSFITAHEHGRPLDLRAGDMLLVDEAGMAATALLDQVRAIAAERGAVVRLVGDYRQLAAVEAGGALRLIHTDRGGTELTRLHRFRDPDEAAAVLALRTGDLACLDFYTRKQRLHGGTRAAVLDELYAAWRADTAAGRTVIMISDSADVARELSVRAQTERRTAGLAETGGVALHEDTTAGVGDRIVTRRNARRLAVYGGADFVKNGDLWDVIARHPDGSLTVRHARHHGRITLPADYVAAHVELGYAATIHRSQGLTVETAHAYLSPLAVREAATVALSRGAIANHVYLDTDTTLELGEPAVLPGDLYYRHREPQQVARALATILRREGAEPSATEQLGDALDEPYRLDVLVPRYEHALLLYRGPDARTTAAAWVQGALPQYAEEILDDEAWPALAETLHRIHDHGADPTDRLAVRAAQRRLTDDPANPARSITKVLHYRLADDLPADHTPGRPDLLPAWVPSPPPPRPRRDPERAELAAWLRHQAQTIVDRVRQLGEHATDQAPPWTSHLGPVPDDPISRDAWIVHAGQLAARRERFGITDPSAAQPKPARTSSTGTAAAWQQRRRGVARTNDDRQRDNLLTPGEQYGVDPAGRRGPRLGL